MIQKKIKNEENKPENSAAHNKKQVALTFDDGPHPHYTQQILETLKKHHAKATFYVLGSRVDFYPNLAKQIVREGHEIGNHSWSHKDLTTLPPEMIQEEGDQSNEAIEKATGSAPKTVRPPFGASNEEVMAAIGLPSILWTVDTMDWKTKNADDILKQVKENTRDGSSS
ncbi:polysaccharide deacetylase family protein [Bacillus sp. UMB0893]|uniref:polysaccharide deacetylase family protein n=1 Tax=Bacillus sp. UMB0893 TaxID=2066053 RepID=UPI0015DEF3EB|nr:polysaccharide deacetylase family protein [Bacillus sp. UMB0893]